MARPIAHPQVEDLSVAAVLHALADPTRAAIVRELLRAPHGLNCTQMNEKLGLELAKSTCSQHFRILREAGLIASERRGVEMINQVRARDLNARFPGLLQAIFKAYETDG